MPATVVVQGLAKLIYIAKSFMASHHLKNLLLIYAIDMVVGTPGRILQHIEEGNMVLDEADTMFDRGFGPDIRKFLAPLKQRALKTNDHGFQTVLVTDTRISIWASS
ncbi:hypothetical protein DY000_02046651 [Brassica cretica]|uniref:Helicase ATP-binding domain-containing protein n=1 Tax=Brassica cretica TaxID=69181 RepID=A0ABQ7F4X1_BRACR|nr:hypothetical protein DY000_02046651 [Brassica cretica]